MPTPPIVFPIVRRSVRWAHGMQCFPMRSILIRLRSIRPSTPMDWPVTLMVVARLTSMTTRQTPRTTPMPPVTHRTRLVMHPIRPPTHRVPRTRSMPGPSPKRRRARCPMPRRMAATHRHRSTSFSSLRLPTQAICSPRPARSSMAARFRIGSMLPTPSVSITRRRRGGRGRSARFSAGPGRTGMSLRG